MTAARPPGTTICVATRDRPHLLSQLLDRLAHQDHPDFEVIVVDNAPADDRTRDLVAAGTWPYPLHYVREPVAGLAIAHNAGIAASTKPIVAFLDDDVEPDAAWARRIAEGFLTDERIQAVTGLIVASSLDTAEERWIEEYGGFGKGECRRVFDDGPNRPADPLFPFASGVIGSGANMAFRRSMLVEMGGFDPALGAGSRAMGGDDLAAFYEVIERGYQVLYEPAAVVRHPHHRDYDALRRQLYGYGVGLSAHLTRVVVTRPRRLLTFARLAVAGARRAFSPTSEKNAGKSSDFPSDLTRTEVRGMIVGPFRYVSSRLSLRGHPNPVKAWK